MAGDAQATRERLISAARTEFAEFGISGARVDRISEAARANKAQIYHYFGSKDALFDAVFNQIVDETVAEAPIDPLDLPGYAGRLFDRYEQRPEVARLASWYRLERAAADRPLDAVTDSNRAKIAAIANAQEAGQLPDHFEPADLLAAVTTLAAMWTTSTPEFGAFVKRHSAAHRRAVVTDAVAALLAG